MPGPGPHASNPNIRVGADGSEYVDPLADLGEFLFSPMMLLGVGAVDIAFNGGDMFGAAFDLGGDVIGGVGDTLSGVG